MKKIFFIISLLFGLNIFFICSSENAISAQTREENKTITKTGVNFGPLPVIAFDADLGFQYGAILNLYNFGDGETYPNPLSQWYFEISRYTKGSTYFSVYYDSKFLIPGMRLSVAASALRSTAMNFYGFNGYRAYFNASELSAYYRMDKIDPTFKADLIGQIGETNFYWEAGYHFNYVKLDDLDRDKINDGKSADEIFPDSRLTLFEQYKKWGIISDDQADGGASSAIRLGLMYDTRNVENAPSKGIWAEAQLIAAPKFLGTSDPYYRYNLMFCNYLPIMDKSLVFAYRLNYLGTFGNSAPFYELYYTSVMGKGSDKNAFGGYRTIRGMLLDRLVGLDVGSFNIELRQRFRSFPLMNQNISLGLSAFMDGGMSFKDLSMDSDISTGSESYVADMAAYNAYIAQGKKNDSMHITTGAGFRFIMNENFIVALEYGVPLDKQDADGGSFYVNLNYLF